MHVVSQQPRQLNKAAILTDAIQINRQSDIQILLEDDNVPMDIIQGVKLLVNVTDRCVERFERFLHAFQIHVRNAGEHVVRLSDDVV